MCGDNVRWAIPDGICGAGERIFRSAGIGSVSVVRCGLRSLMSRGSGGSDQFDDALNGVIGAMISGFETAVRAMLGIWSAGFSPFRILSTYTAA